MKRESIKRFLLARCLTLLAAATPQALDIALLDR